MTVGHVQPILSSKAKPGSPDEVRHLTQGLIRDLGPRLPLPGDGETSLRWRILAEIGAFDLSVAKLVESHYDAIAIMDEAAVKSHTGIYGVWASRFGGRLLRGEFDERTGLWLIQGELAFASGLSTVDYSLVPVATPKGEILFQIPIQSVVPDSIDLDRWHTPGMKDADTAWIRVEAQLSESEAVGGPGYYLSRPGFWAGAAGVAACWLGAAQRLFESWQSASRQKAYADPHDQAVRAHAFSSLKACSTQLMAFADRLDERKVLDEDVKGEALMIRHLVDRAANEVVERSLRSLGPMLMVGDAEYSRRCLDLQIFTRQCHGDKDLVQLSQELDRRFTDNPKRTQEVWFE